METFIFAIGIDTYDSPEIQPLRGCVDDLHLFTDYLIGCFGVPEKNIVQLINESATRENIISRFRSHLNQNQRVHAGDRIVFFYAGHGVRSSPPAICDEIICPFDVNLGGDTPDAPDHTIHNILCELAETKGNNITVILDCRVFTIAQIPRGGGGFGDVISHDGPHSLSNDTSSLSYTMIVSFQEGGQKSARNSVSFAQGMVKYMSSHSRHIAPQQLIHAVRRENLAASVSVQGMKHHSIFETSLPDQNFHMRVKQLQDGSGCLEVAGGPEHGFRPGQLVHLALGGRRLGQAKVQRTQSGTTILADVTGLDTKDVQFVEVIPPGHILKVFNAAGYSIPEPGPFDWYEVVSDESDADMILRKASSGQLSIVPHDRLFHRYDATFLPLKNVEARLLNRISRFRTILHLPHSTLYNDISPLPTSGCLELELFPLAWDAQGAFLEPSTASLFRDGYSTNITLSNPDQCYGLKITQNYGADMYLYLLAFNTADFTVTTCYSNHERRFSFNESVTVGYGWRGGDPIYFNVDPSLPKETVFFKVLGSTEWIDPSVWTEEAFSGAVNSRGANSYNALFPSRDLPSCLAVATLIAHE